MNITEELVKLEELRQRGSLSDEEFQRAKARLLDAKPPAVSGSAALNSLRRSNVDRWVGGVCGGLAVSLGIDSWAIRLVFALLFFVGGTGVLLYILMWLFVPLE